MTEMKNGPIYIDPNSNNIYALCRPVVTDGPKGVEAFGDDTKTIIFFKGEKPSGYQTDYITQNLEDQITAPHLNWELAYNIDETPPSFIAIVL